jgi:flagellar hook protein FlgE
MLRSMFSAIGGLKNHQLMMDVTANNIANVNTIGYKSERATFSAMLSQTVRGASAPTAGGAGGVNPTQVGLGVALGGIQDIETQGSLQTTGQWSDMAVQGDGFFVISDARPTATPTAALFTRAGNFSVDVNGDLVTQTGQYVMGNTLASAGPPPTFNDDLGAINIPVTAQGVSIGSDGTVTYTDASGAQQISGRVAVAKFPNPAGLTRMGDNLWATSPNSGVYDSTNSNNSGTPAAGVASWGAAGLNGRGSIQSGTVEMSNVDLASEFTAMITAQRGFQANSKVISASDEMLQDLVNLKR